MPSGQPPPIEDDAPASELDIGPEELVSQLTDGAVDDDEGPSDVDLGVALLPPDSVDEEEEGPADLDIAGLFTPAENWEAPEEDDDGPVEPPSFPLHTALEQSAGEFEEGMQGEHAPTLPPLPALDEDDRASLEAQKKDTLDLARIRLRGDSPPEEGLESIPVFLSFRPRVEARLWNESVRVDVPETTLCLNEESGQIRVGGDGLRALAPAAQALSGPTGLVSHLSGDLAIAAGELFARGAEGAWKRMVLPSERSATAICSFPTGGLVLTDEGCLWRYDRKSGSWERSCSAVAIAKNATGAVLLAPSGDQEGVHTSPDGGLTWEALPRSEVARPYCASSATAIGAAGPWILLAEPSVGIAISADKGATFSQIPGTFEVTAIACGQAATDAPVRAFAAIPSNASAGTDIVEIGPSGDLVAVIARVETSPSGAEEAVRALCFDATNDLLWALLDTTVVAWRPPNN